jgi:hypothetical protein
LTLPPKSRVWGENKGKKEKKNGKNMLDNWCKFDKIYNNTKIVSDLYIQMVISMVDLIYCA